MEADEAPADLADFMNDWFFFGTVGARRSGGAYDLTGESGGKRPAPTDKQQQQPPPQGMRRAGAGSASRETQEWLEEAKRMVIGAGSPGRKGVVGSPSRQVPRFAAGGSGTDPSTLDRRDPMSRSARRHRQPSGIGDEILQRASVSSSPPRADLFASAPSSPAHALPPNPQSTLRKSRFHEPSALDSSFSAAHRRTSSSATTSPTSAPNPRHPHHRRHASASSALAVDGFDDGVARLNSFLRRQRAAVAELVSGGRPASIPTKVVLSDASKSVSSIAAAICYAWMLASKADAQAVVPMVNMRRGRMDSCRQAAWLLYHVGVDASALLFADERLMYMIPAFTFISMLDCLLDGLSLHNPHQQFEGAYSLLQSLDIKKLLLAGILFDTNNLSNIISNRDSEAVQLLLLGTSEYARHELFQQLMLDHNDHSFVEYMKNTYRKSFNNGEGDSPPDQKHSVSASGSSQDAKKPSSNGGKASDEAPRVKNKFFLAKWFGFGPK